MLLLFMLFLYLCMCFLGELNVIYTGIMSCMHTEAFFNNQCIFLQCQPLTPNARFRWLGVVDCLEVCSEILNHSRN